MHISGQHMDGHIMKFQNPVRIKRKSAVFGAKSRTLAMEKYSIQCLFKIYHIVTTPTQPKLNSKVGFDTKMTQHHPPPAETQHQHYLSCYGTDFDQTLDGGIWDQQQQHEQQQQHQQQ